MAWRCLAYENFLQLLVQRKHKLKSSSKIYKFMRTPILWVPLNTLELRYA